MFEGQNIIITGGAGSLGSELARYILRETQCRQLRLLDSNEYELFRLGKELSDQRVRLCLGDIRDYNRVKEALSKANIIIHTAALKNIELTEDNPKEAIETNIKGTQNICEVAKYEQCKTVCNISSDKAVNPTSLYGATKLVGEKIVEHFAESNDRPIYYTVRPPNYYTSRGNVFEVWNDQQLRGIPITVTDPLSTRFFISTDIATKFIVDSLSFAERGKTYIPKGEEKSVDELAFGYNDRKIIGLRKGEKLKEQLWSKEESIYIHEHPTYYEV